LSFFVALEIELKELKNMIQELIDNISETSIQNFIRSKNSAFKEINEDCCDIEIDNRFSDLKKLGYIDYDDSDSLLVFSCKYNDDLSSRSSKKMQFEIAKNLLNDVFKDGAVFVFYDNAGRFRFSFIRKNYGDKEQKFTPWRRYTYYVDKRNQTNKTFKDCIGNASFSSLEKIQEGFSLEPLSIEFFDKYKEIYGKFVGYITGKYYKKKSSKNWEEVDYADHEPDFIQFKKEFNSNHKQVRDYVKKLLGRLVFLKFIEKKGWLGEIEGTGEIEPNFLENVFKNSSYQDDFLDKVLEEVIFESLNNPIGNTNKCEELKKYSFPYLNGGLFEKDELDKQSIHFPKEYFEEIFAFFNQYNFTIDENDPNDAEVSVDPEMLGHIFENLLEDNKDKGAFYTPKEIVHYMCQESLIEYLCTSLSYEKDEQKDLIIELVKTKEINKGLKDNLVEIEKALEKVKICDPAIGSGAFPMGLLQEIFSIKQSIYYQKNNTLDNFPAGKEKLNIIQNNIYGVDIEQGAVDIARLRFWLSLVVEETKATPLPNLDYKIMQGNSLIENFEGVDLSKLIPIKKEGTKGVQKDIFGKISPKDFQVSLDFKEGKDTAAEIQKLFKQYFQIHNTKIKNELRNSIDEKVKEHIIACCNENPPVIEKVKAINPKNKPFFLWHLYFAEAFREGGFDIVIGNPPYVSTKGGTLESKNILEYTYGFADDTYNHFFFKGIDLIKSNGNLTYIIPKTFWTTQTKKNMRDLILSNKINYIFDTGNPFNTAMVDTCIISVKKASNKNNIINFFDGSKDIEKPIKYKINQSIYFNVQNSVIFKPTNENIVIYEKYGQKIKELYDKWWDKIKTSRDIEKNKEELRKYRESLKPGEIALLGCLTEGGQGLATANNGKYIAVRKSTKWAKNIIDSRPKKLFDAINSKKIIIDGMERYSNVSEYLNSLSEKQIASLFDNIKEKYGRDIFGQGYLYKIIDDAEIANVDELTKDEKQNGIDTSKKYYVPYDKGDKDGNRWYLETPFAIAWSKENVHFLKTDPKARYQGYMYYFREGFCWSDINTTYLKCRIKEKSINDVKSMSLYSMYEKTPEYYFISIINSEFMSKYVDDFVNNTQTFQINDARQIPIIIPDSIQLKVIEKLFQKSFILKKQKNNECNNELIDIQRELDKTTLSLYHLFI
jgi:hypothetical protein